MTTDAIEVEVNLMASGKMKNNSGRDPTKPRREHNLRHHKHQRIDLKQ
jgi:hypothetical protein